MLIRKEHTADGAILGVWEMDESRNELLHLLPPRMRALAEEHIQTLRSERRTLEWLSTRILLFSLLEEEKTILNRPDGRPYLSDESYRISISHTKGYAAILLHQTLAVGIDIESLSERVNKVTSKFIGDTEYIDPSKKTVHQLLHWSAKESLFKLMEENEIHFKHHLHIHPFIPATQGTITATETKTGRNTLFALHYEVHPLYVLTWLASH